MVQYIEHLFDWQMIVTLFNIVLPISRILLIQQVISSHKLTIRHMLSQTSFAIIKLWIRDTFQIDLVIRVDHRLETYTHEQHGYQQQPIDKFNLAKRINHESCRNQ